MQQHHQSLKNQKPMISRFKIKIQESGRERWADADKVFAHLLKEYNKKEAKFKELLSQREENFIKQVKVKLK